MSVIFDICVRYNVQPGAPAVCLLYHEPHGYFGASGGGKVAVSSVEGSRREP